ncbi:CHAD domain-containing protein [Roseomonas sp. BN140053]|uniref:CYTH and CHAD domain-containing protein n=1 Tax=Roseomonas sp. BN140053 TaxID=3391898 RepID=UPI0039E8FCA3
MTDPEQQPPRELEIKLVLPEAVTIDLGALPWLNGMETGAPDAGRQVSIYFDTPGRDLLRNGLALRIRRSGEKRVQTLKSRSDGTAFGRGEWESPINRDAPELKRLAGTPAEPVLGLAAALEPMFESDVRRTRRHLRLVDGSEVELALDEGVLRAAESSEPIREVELELKRGAPAALYRLAADLAAALPGAMLSTDSKSERGWRLLDRAPPAPRKAEHLQLPEDIGTAEGIRRILGTALRHLLANLPAARAGQMGGVHQARVAVRRLRAALNLFEPKLGKENTARLEAELQRLGQALGAARDWDVFCEETLRDAAEDAAAAPWLPQLRELAEAERVAAHRELEADLAQPALTRLILDLAAWIEEPAGLEDGSAPLADFARPLLKRLERKVHRRGKGLRHRPVEELHALRKSLKKLRYGLEFLGGLFPSRKVHRYLRGCTALQERLGTINDAATAKAMVARLAGAGDLAAAAAAMAHWADLREEAALRQLGDAWADYKDHALPR